MWRALIPGSLLLVVLGCGDPPPPEPVPDPYENLVTRLDSVMRSMAGRGFSGVALVGLRDRVLLHGAYDGKGLSPDTNTAYRIASITKQFTAAAMMKLVEEHKVSLDDPISRFFPDAPKDKQAITIRHLLSLTSGLGNVPVEGITERAAVEKAILSTPLDHPTGEFQYQNSNFQLAAAIIEKVSGQPWHVFVKKELLDAAFMGHTGFWGHETDVPVRVAAPHDSMRYQASYALTFRDGKPLAQWGQIGAGGMFSTTWDLYRWSHALRNEKVLDAVSLEQLFTPVITVRSDSATHTDVSYALGWVVERRNGKRVEVRHTGHGDWTNNAMIRMLDNGGVVITIAADFGPNTDPMAYAAADVLDSLLMMAH